MYMYLYALYIHVFFMHSLTPSPHTHHTHSPNLAPNMSTCRGMQEYAYIHQFGPFPNKIINLYPKYGRQISQETRNVHASMYMCMCMYVYICTGIRMQTYLYIHTMHASMHIYTCLMYIFTHLPLTTHPLSTHSPGAS